MLYIYISKDETDFSAVADQHHALGGVTIGSVRDPQGRRIVVLHRPTACDRLRFEIGAGHPAAGPLRELLAEIRRLLGRGADAPLTILIHFGGQGRDECIAFTQAMNEAARSDSELTGFRFIAVSQYNNCPEGFFLNRRFTLPDDAVVNEVFAQWSEGKNDIPVYDHLRGIVLLCQALQELDEEERKKQFTFDIGIKWWRNCLWDANFSQNEENAFSPMELRILEQSRLIRDFCLALLNAPDKLIRYSDRLPEITAEITNFLNKG